MRQVWETYCGKAQAEGVIRNMACDDPLPPVGHALWLCPGNGTAVSITKTRAKGQNGRLLYHVAVYAAPAANTEA